MKLNKRAISLILAVVMVFSLPCTASATDIPNVIDSGMEAVEHDAGGQALSNTTTSIPYDCTYGCAHKKGETCYYKPLDITFSGNGNGLLKTRAANSPVDLTDIAGSGGDATLPCIWLAEYDDAVHFKRCINHSGTGTWNGVRHAGGKKDVTTHALQNVGNAATCDRYVELGYEYCTIDCGYRKNYERLAHLYPEPPIWRDAGQWHVDNRCNRCGGYSNNGREGLHTINGKTLNEIPNIHDRGTVTCDICQFTVDVGSHFEMQNDGTCWLCHEALFPIITFNTNTLPNFSSSDLSYVYATIDTRGKINDAITLYADDHASTEQPFIVSTPEITSRNGNYIYVRIPIRLKDRAKPLPQSSQWYLYFTGTFKGTGTSMSIGKLMWMGYSGGKPQPVGDAVITKSGVSAGWATNIGITARFKAPLASRTDFAIFLNNVQLTEWKPGTPTGNPFEFTCTLTPLIDVSASKQYVIKCRDILNGMGTQAVNIDKTDSAAPVLIAPDDLAKDWAKQKDVIFTATDEGIGKVQIAFNSESDYLPATQSGATFTRGYNFIGDVYTKQTRPLYLKDGLGNARLALVEIDKLDNTPPSVTGATLTPNKNLSQAALTIVANDNHPKLGTGSGVRLYALTKNDTPPTGGWQGSGQFGVSKNGAYYLWVKDNVGLASATYKYVVNVLDETPPIAPTVTKSPTATWHNNNVTVTVSGGNDAQSGINRYQYSINGGAWTDYTKPFIVSATSSVNARTVDNVGLTSGGTNIAVNIDRAAPTDTINYNKAWTNNALELSFTASDLGGSGIAKVRPAGGTWVSGGSAKQTVSANGSYSFESADNAGNTNISPVTVSNIDKALPVVDEINFIKTNDNLFRMLFNKQVEISIVTSDNASGVTSVEYQLVPEGGSIDGGAWLTYSAASKPRVAQRFHGTVAARCTDVADNISAVKQEEVTIENTPPTASHTLSTDDWTNAPVTITVTALDDLSGVDNISLPDGTVVQGNTAQYTAPQNGKYSFIITDKCGNAFTYDVDIGNIDLTPATATHTLSPSYFTNTDVVITVTAEDEESGVKSITLPDGSVIDGEIASLTVSKNDTFRFIVTNVVGATIKYDVQVSNTDYVPPEITGFALREVEENPVRKFLRGVFPAMFAKQVDLLVTAGDDYSGINTIEYQVTDRGTPIQDSGWRVCDSDKPPRLSEEMDATVAVRTTDNAGNVSAIVSKDAVIDGSAPIGSHTLSATDWVRTYIDISVSAKDKWTKAAYITLPDGKMVNGDAAVFRVVRNGDYPFILTDELGNSDVYTVTIGNIDYVQPEITGFALREVEENPVRKFLRGVFPAMFAKQVELLVTAEDDYSGINTIEYQVTDKGAPLQDSGWRVCDSEKPPRLSEEMDATVAVRTTDNAGNVSAIVSKDAVIDGSAPIGSHTLSTTDWVRTYIDISVTAKDKWTKAAYITLPNGKMVNGDAAVFRAVRNGDYPFILTDELGNSGVYTVTVGNIEEWQPTPPKMGVEDGTEPTDELYIPDDAELGWDISRIDVKSLAQSGIEKYQYISTPRIIPVPPINEQPQMRARMAGTAPEWKDCGEEITEAGEGIYDVEVRAVTYASNVSEVSHYVLKNDYTPPTGTNKNDSRSIEFTAADALSGVAKISCEHGEVLGEAVTCEMLKTETHVYTVTDNAGVSAEIPVEFIRPSSNNQNGSDESGPEPWVEEDEPAASIPLPVPPSTDNGAVTEVPEAPQGGGENGYDKNSGDTVKNEDITVQPLPGGSSESLNGRSGIFAGLLDALKTLFAKLAELMQRLWAWFMSLPLAVRIIIFTLWWLLFAALVYYLWRRYREKEKKADK